MSLLEDLNNIINTKEIRPTIINEESHFVIVTYWWGRNAMNQNTSRPCISFFEKIVIILWAHAVFEGLDFQSLLWCR